MPSLATVTLKGLNGRATQIGQLGYGTMHMTWTPQPVEDKQAFEALKTAIDGGSTMINTATFYGTENPVASLQLLSRFFKANPAYATKCFVSVKGGTVGSNIAKYDASEENLRKDLEKIADALGPVKKMDLYQMARVDHHTPIEKTMELYKRFVEEGHFQYIGLSECSADTIRRAAKVVPIALVELEYSPFSLEIETNGCLQACADFNIPITAYSPLGRGLMTRRFQKPEDLPQGDPRLRLERFQPENFHKNLELVDKFDAVSKRLGVTTTQLTLAWELARNKPAIICPIPGSRRVEGVQESLGAQQIKLSEQDLAEVRKAIDGVKIHGGRASEMMKSHLEGSTPAL